MNKFGGFISAMHSFDVFIRTFDPMLLLAMLGNSIFSYVLIVTISEKKEGQITKISTEFLINDSLALERFDVSMGKQMLGQLMFQTKYFSTKWTRMISGFVVCCRKMLFQSISM